MRAQEGAIWRPRVNHECHCLRGRFVHHPAGLASQFALLDDPCTGRQRVSPPSIWKTGPVFLHPPLLASRITRAHLRSGYSSAFLLRRGTAFTPRAFSVSRHGGLSVLDVQGRNPSAEDLKIRSHAVFTCKQRIFQLRRYKQRNLHLVRNFSAASVDDILLEQQKAVQPSRMACTIDCSRETARWRDPTDTQNVAKEVKMEKRTALENPVIYVLGPTGVGKTKLAVDLCLSLHDRYGIHAEIVNADSMQVYRGCDVGTAKATAEEQRQVPHHLLDICDASTQNFSVVKYLGLALQTIQRLHAAGTVPVVVGGTQLYIQHLLWPSALDFYLVEPLLQQPEGESMEIEGEPSAKETTTPPFVAARAGQGAEREESEDLELLPSEVLHARLSLVDPERAMELHPRDRRRIIRSLETFAACGEPQSVLMRRYRDESARRGLRFPTCILWVDCRDEKEHMQRLRNRAHAMVQNGLLKECEFLLDMLHIHHFPPPAPLKGSNTGGAATAGPLVPAASFAKASPFSPAAAGGTGGGSAASGIQEAAAAAGRASSTAAPAAAGDDSKGSTAAGGISAAAAADGPRHPGTVAEANAARAAAGDAAAAGTGASIPPATTTPAAADIPASKQAAAGNTDKTAFLKSACGASGLHRRLPSILDSIGYREYLTVVHHARSLGVPLSVPTDYAAPIADTAAAVSPSLSAASVSPSLIAAAISPALTAESSASATTTASVSPSFGPTVVSPDLAAAAAAAAATFGSLAADETLKPLAPAVSLSGPAAAALGVERGTSLTPTASAAAASAGGAAAAGGGKGREDSGTEKKKGGGREEGAGVHTKRGGLFNGGHHGKGIAADACTCSPVVGTTPCKPCLSVAMEQLVMRTRLYARKQRRWIINKFLLRQQRLPIYLLDTSGASSSPQWETQIREPALQIVRDFYFSAPFDQSHPLAAARHLTPADEARRQFYRLQQQSQLRKAEAPQQHDPFQQQMQGDQQMQVEGYGPEQQQQERQMAVFSAYASQVDNAAAVAASGALLGQDIDPWVDAGLNKARECSVCQRICHGLSDWKDHLQSRMHKARLQRTKKRALGAQRRVADVCVK